VKFGANARPPQEKKKEGEDPLLSLNAIFKPVTPAQKVEQGKFCDYS